MVNIRLVTFFKICLQSISQMLRFYSRSVTIELNDVISAIAEILVSHLIFLETETFLQTNCKKLIKLVGK
jgi:hypothetical protein